MTLITSVEMLRVASVAVTYVTGLCFLQRGKIREEPQPRFPTVN